MSRAAQDTGRSVIPALLAVLIVASLAGLVIKRRAARIRDGFVAHRLYDELGELRNERRFLDGKLATLSRPAKLLPRARRVGLRFERGNHVDVIAPASRGTEEGQ